MAQCKASRKYCGRMLNAMKEERLHTSNWVNTKEDGANNFCRVHKEDDYFKLLLLKITLQVESLGVFWHLDTLFCVSHITALNNVLYYVLFRWDCSAQFKCYRWSFAIKRILTFHLTVSCRRGIKTWRFMINHTLLHIDNKAQYVQAYYW